MTHKEKERFKHMEQRLHDMEDVLVINKWLQKKKPLAICPIDKVVNCRKFHIIQ